MLVGPCRAALAASCRASSELRSGVLGTLSGTLLHNAPTAHRIIVGDAGFKPGTSAPEVWCATNEPPHLHHITIAES